MSTSRKLGFATAAALAAFVGACASSKVLIPPRMDLARCGTIGMINFEAGADGDLGQFASQEFLASVQAAQPGTPVLELGASQEVLYAVKRTTIDPETIKAIGKKYAVDAIVFGRYTTEELRPRVSLDPASLNASAEIQGHLESRIYDTRTGATLWTNTAGARQTVAKVQLGGGGIAGGGQSMDDVHDRLVHSLVDQVTTDFWPHWE